MKKTGILREIRESTDDELKARMGRLEEELFGHRMKRHTNQLANTMKIRQARHELARVQTVLARRASGAEKPVAKKAD